MSQIEQATQATSVTGADIDAAIQDERMIELERRIEKLEAALIAVNCTAAAEPTALTAAEIERAKGVYTTAATPACADTQTGCR